MLHTLPSEILQVIALYLDILSLARFAQVSTLTRASVVDPIFGIEYTNMCIKSDRLILTKDVYIWPSRMGWLKVVEHLWDALDELTAVAAIKLAQTLRTYPQMDRRILMVKEQYSPEEHAKLIELIRSEMFKIIRDAAISADNIEVIKWLFNKEKLPKGINYIVPGEVIFAAAKFGRTTIMEWALANGADKWNCDVCYDAAKEGNLVVIKWAVKNSLKFDFSKCKLAARKHPGVVEYVKYLESRK